MLWCCICVFISAVNLLNLDGEINTAFRERSGSVVECLTRDRRARGTSLASVTGLRDTFILA